MRQSLVNVKTLQWRVPTPYADKAETFALLDPEGHRSLADADRHETLARNSGGTAAACDFILNLDGKRKGSVGFALTALQRRLASSPEAIFQSLKRRRERLERRLREEEMGARGQRVLAEERKMGGVRMVATK